MQRQTSRDRKLVRNPEQLTSIPRPELPFRPWPIVSCSLFVCILIGLAYLFHSTDISLVPVILPGQHHQNPQTDETITARPRMELHPEDHMYRTPTTQYLDWRVTSDYRRPDGVLKQVYLINGLFPGPTVEARSGDTLIITVTNSLVEESIAVHWHGIHVTNAMDGAAGVSQCPVPPGSQFVYNLTIPSDQSGTFWYHAHSGVSRADGFYGGLVIHQPASKSTVRGLVSRSRDDIQRYTYDKELLLLIGDWYHRPASDVLEWYTSPGNFGNEPVPDSVLVNGVGGFNCTMAVPARPVDCIDQRVDTSFIGLDPHTAYRIRVANTGALAGLSLVFDHHRLELLQVDSVDTARSNETNINSIGILFPGQRMDFVLRPASPNNSDQVSMTVQLDQDCFKYPNPVLTPNQTFKINYPSSNTHETPLNTYHLNLERVSSAPSILSRIPLKAQQTHMVYTKIQKLAQYSNKPLGFFNQTSWKPQQDPSVALVSLPRNEWDANQLTINTGLDAAWVDLIINNLDEGSHPFHMHGHHFYILAVNQTQSGWGSYNPFTDKIPSQLQHDSELQRIDKRNVEGNETGFDFGVYDTSQAALRDTVNIPSRSYAVLRFRADNPGVWLLHCHILWHLATGMAMLVDVQGDPAGLAAHISSGGICSAP